MKDDGLGTMALVVFLRGVNVGGHKTFQPSVLARALAEYDVVNVGAAGTFVVRRPVAQTTLRAELQRRLPFDAEIMMCPGRDIVDLASDDPFQRQPSAPDIVRFVSVLAARPRTLPALPISLPSEGNWLLTIVEIRSRFVLGMYRRQMKAISYLGQVEKRLGVSSTTRNWNTIASIAKVLSATR